MRELPMLLNGEMVRATLAGTKRQTRRPVKPQPPEGSTWDDESRLFVLDGSRLGVMRHNPLGAPGDLLYVRETCRAEELPDGLDGIRYLADGAFIEIEDSPEAGERWSALYHYRHGEGLTVPSIHMPKWATRLWVRNTGVRVERVQDITEEDVIAEGVNHEWIDSGQECWGIIPGEYSTCPFEAYAWLWDSIYAKSGLGWEENPWVWVTSYEVTER